MPTGTIRTLDVRTRRQWRKWLEEHHDLESEIWVVFYKRNTNVHSLSYDDAVERQTR